MVEPKNDGPRFDCAFRKDLYDDVSNLILLCASHHILIDKQSETYTATMLSEIKEKHEKSVCATLSSSNVSEQKIVRIEEEIPTHLKRVLTGEDLLGILSSAYGYEFSNSDISIVIEDMGY